MLPPAPAPSFTNPSEYARKPSNFESANCGFTDNTGISDKKNDVYDHWIEIPSVDEALYPIIEIIPIQLLAYYSALEKKTDPDYPRNLAKSVTVK